MPRFYFDFCQGNDRIPDAEGTELANAEQAYLEAFNGASDLWGDLLKQRQDPRRCRFEVRSEEGDLLFILPFQEVLDSCQNREPVALHRTRSRAISVSMSCRPSRAARATARTGMICGPSIRLE